MRIDSIGLVNFGSHDAKTWEPGDARLSVVVGPNGAGKSTLLVDAPLFAIFGEVPGGYSPDQLVRTGATDMSVTVELEHEGRSYRVIRRRTVRAGGKSSADLQVRASDGSWTPIASGPREVTAEAVRLLRMDQHTFRTAVFLAQGDAKRFMDATPGKGTPTAPGRAAILSTLVVDPVFARAEVRAREEARDLEAKTAAERAQAERLADVIAELEPARGIRDAAAEDVATLTAQAAALAAEREAKLDRLTVLAGELAAGAAAIADVSRLEAERDALAERYRRERAAVAAADEAIAAAGATLLLADDVAVATVELPVARGVVESLVEAEAIDRTAAAEIADRRRAFDPLERALAESRATWTAELRGAQARVSELVAGVNALEPVICRECGAANVVDQAGLTGQLAAARSRVTELEAAEPTETMALSRERVAIKRLEERRAESPFDWQKAAAARGAVTRLEQAAARGEAMDAAQAALVRARAAKVAATEELGRISVSGQAVAEQLARAKTAAAGIAPLEAEQAQLQVDAGALATDIAAGEGARREAERRVAHSEAQVERLEQVIAQRDGILAGLQAADVTLARIRKMVAAFGVKGIPARVVEGVLPELVAHANDMLGQLRPGMTLDIRANRAKADGSGTIEALDIWIRDWRGERQRWSGGEGTSVSMSIAVALSRLGARRSGARVATLVIDEPDGLDSDSRRAFGQALRVLAHRGDLERVAVITHQDGIPDFADDVVELEPAVEPFGSIDTAA